MVFFSETTTTTSWLIILLWYLALCHPHTMGKRQKKRVTVKRPPPHAEKQIPPIVLLTGPVLEINQVPNLHDWQDEDGT